jgi:hypothetical protein
MERAPWSSARWLAAVLGATLACVAAVVAFNAWVDPFQHYHVATRFPPRFYTLHHRYIDPGLARNAAYDVALSGSSIMENTRNDVMASACGGPAVNLSMPAMSAAEQRLILDVALRSRPLRRAIVVLDFNQFAGAPDARQEVAGPLPLYLYDDNPLNDLPYVLSWDVLRRSWSIVRGREDAEFRTDAAAPWYWAPRKTFGRTAVLAGLDLARLNARFQQPARTLAGMQASFERNLLPLLARHPGTRFDLVWPPYSILVWLDFAQRDQLEVTLAFKRYVADATRALPNVHLHDLQAEAAITHDLDRYTDIYHFDAAVNDWMVQAVCAAPDTTAAGLVQAEAALRAQVARVATPAGLAAVVGDGAAVAAQRNTQAR